MQEAKRALRKEVKKTLAGLSAESIARQSAAVTQKLLAMPVYQRARAVSIFISKAGPEISTTAIIHDLLNRNVNCYIPRCVSDTVMQMVRVTSIADLNSLPLNRMGIPEPLLDEKRENALDGDGLDLIIMPGLAFDRTRSRIGYGRGYYDRFLQDYQARFGATRPAATVAIALDEQLVEHVPVDDFDRKPDAIVLPSLELAAPQFQR
ncbi:hypothetical protein HDU96_007917 [Phlyctochytrium bullatum]|nr:hypothetical protein HDU96_007917 [Phlyctochytrium bullatum]